MLFDPLKRNFAKGHPKGQKVHISVFPPYVCTLDPFLLLTRVNNFGLKSMPEVRYGSQLHPPFEKIVCDY